MHEYDQDEPNKSTAIYKTYSYSTMAGLCVPSHNRNSISEYGKDIRVDMIESQSLKILEANSADNSQPGSGIHDVECSPSVPGSLTKADRSPT
jgi:hypothetical protein